MKVLSYLHFFNIFSTQFVLFYSYLFHLEEHTHFILFSYRKHLYYSVSSFFLNFRSHLANTHTAAYTLAKFRVDSCDCPLQCGAVERLVTPCLHARRPRRPLLSGSAQAPTAASGSCPATQKAWHPHEHGGIDLPPPRSYLDVRFQFFTRRRNTEVAAHGVVFLESFVSHVVLHSFLRYRWT